MANDRMPFHSQVLVPEKEDNQLKKYNQVWNDINTLLSYLRAQPFDVPWLMDEFFLKKHGNPAPGELLRRQIERVQKHLENAD